MGVKDLNKIKRNLLSFKNIIWLLVISFVVYEIYSLYGIEYIYIEIYKRKAFFQFISSVVIIGLAIFIIYYLPVLFVIIPRQKVLRKYAFNFLNNEKYERGKKNKNYIIYFIIYNIILISGIVVISFLPKYNQHVYVLKHTLIYILAVSIIIMIIKRIYNKFLKRYKDIFIGKRLYILKGFTIFTVISLLAMSNYFQFNYIKLYETPPIVNCYYYDEFGNYIHGSRIKNVCPELEIINKTDNSLIFKAEYIYPGTEQYSFKEELLGYRGHDGYAIVNIEIKYNDENYITSYTSQTSMNYELLEFDDDKGSIHKYYHSLLLSIKNTYNEDKVMQTVSRYTKKIEDINYKNIREVEHYDFSNSEPFIESSIDLLVTNKSKDYLEFEVYDTQYESDLLYVGSIDYSKESTVLFCDHYPDYVNVKPKKITDTYILSDDHITHSSGSHFRFSEYSKVKDYKPMIQTVYPIENETETYELDNSVIIQSIILNYKMYQTSYGYKVEEYFGDGHREETPYVSDDYLTDIYYGKDSEVFVRSPIKLEYSKQPIINLNPILKYILEQND